MTGGHPQLDAQRLETGIPFSPSSGPGTALSTHTPHTLSEVLLYGTLPLTQG